MLGNWNKCRESRLGIVLHYDDSTSDAGALEWLLKDPRCHVSYNWIISDDGTLTAVAPEDARAWHAGVCRPSSAQLTYRDANSALYGIAIAASGKDHATPAQLDAVAALCRRLFAKHGWAHSETWRITTHSREAWPRGRKVDCEGTRPHDPVLDPDAIRRRLEAL